MRIAPECPYASLFLTALDKRSTLATTQTALLSAVARSCNSGSRVFSPEEKMVANGKAPILLEPVKATITVGRDISTVNLLDQDGRRTGRTLPVHARQFTIDGAKDKALYYEVVFTKGS